MEWKLWYKTLILLLWRPGNICNIQSSNFDFIFWMVALELNAIEKSFEYNFNNIVIVKVQKDANISPIQFKQNYGSGT